MITVQKPLGIAKFSAGMYFVKLGKSQFYKYCCQRTSGRILRNVIAVMVVKCFFPSQAQFSKAIIPHGSDYRARFQFSGNLMLSLSRQPFFISEVFLCVNDFKPPHHSSLLCVLELTA